MATSEQYRELIATFDHRMLLELWEQVLSGETPAWDPGMAFEYLILRVFQLEGAVVRWPYSVKLDDELIEQIDGNLFVEGLSCLVEVKDHCEPLDFGPIAKLRSQLLRRHSATIGVVFSRAGFTGPAITLARFCAPQAILLWQGDEIDLALRRKVMVRGLVEKYRHAVTFGLPDLNVVATLSES
jgi:hypothetical protein